MSAVWADTDWAVLLAGWASLQGGYWLGQGAHTVAWVDETRQLWVNGQPRLHLSATRPVEEQLEDWLKAQSLRWVCHPARQGDETISAEIASTLPHGGWVVYGAYEAFQLFEPVLVGQAKLDPDGWPLLVLVAFKTYHWFDPATGKQAVWQSDPGTPPAGLSEGWQSIESCGSQGGTTGFRPEDDQPLASLDQAGFEQAVRQVLEDIQTGDLYQANLSIRFEHSVTLDPLLLFSELLRVNPSPFCAVLKTPWGWLVSNSPERLVAVDGDGQVSARPIAGTRSRGQCPDSDLALHAELLAHPKERAEHLMLVDLARNDLGRVCQPGSVVVDELLTLEPYSHVTHLVSNVVGQRSPGVSLLGVLAAVFPGGTITGCPKIRCVERLAGLEPVARTFYTGTLGWLDLASGTMDTNILIRSVRLLPDEKVGRWRAQWHAGAGIVADSDPTAEYEESLRKAAVMAQTLAKLSTPLDAPAPAC